jgi:hypothetical protein
MNLKKFLVAGLVGGVVGNVLDFVVHGQVLAGQYYSKVPQLFRTDTPTYYFVILDFVAALVLTWVWAKVHTSFGSGAKAGATGGLYAGVLVNFPCQIFPCLMYVGFPSPLCWIWTIYGILWFVIVGMVIGALYKE